MTPPRSAASPRPSAAADLPAYGLAAVTLAGFAGGWHWLLDLTSHFRWYWLLAALVWGAVAGRRRSRSAVACVAVAIAANAWAILPYWLPAAGGTDEGGAVEIVTLNVFALNADKDRTLDYLRHRGADVVVLVEIDAAWAEAIESLAALYPHRLIEPRVDMFGVAVLSQLPLEDPRVEEFAAGPPAIVTGVCRGERGFLLVAAHPPAPISAA